MLNEDLNAWTQANAAQLSLPEVFAAIRYSPDYDTSYESIEIRSAVPADDVERIESIVNRVNEKISETTKANGMRVILKKVAAQVKQPTLSIEFPQKSFGKLAAALKKKGIKFQPTRNGDKITLSGGKADLKNAFLVWHALVAGEDPTTVTLVGADDSLGDKQTDFDSRFTTPAQSSDVGVRVICPSFGVAGNIYALAFGKDGTDIVDGSKLTTLPPDRDYAEDLAVKDALVKASLYDSFMKSIVTTADATDTMRALIKVVNNTVLSHGSVPDTLKAFKEARIAFKLNAVNARIAVAKKNAANVSGLIPKEHVEAAKAFLANVMPYDKVQTYDDLTSITDNKDGDLVDSTGFPIPANPCAKRRIKLFSDAADEGAAIHYNSRWIVALTYTSSQNGIFGRNKPAADRQNNVIERLNRRDVEQVTDSDGAVREVTMPQEDRAIRDSQDINYVKDDLPGNANNTRYESNWCTTGGGYGSKNGRWSARNDSTFFTHYIHPGRNEFYAVFMELATGMMYQYAPFDRSKMFMYEQEHASSVGLIYGSNTDYTGNMRRARANDTAFDDIVQWVETTGNVSTGVTSSARSSVITRLSQMNAITASGQLVITETNLDYILHTMPRNMLSEFSSILLKLPNAFQAFAGIDFNGIDLPPIDCQYVNVADLMFNGAIVVGGEGIRLKNTSAIESMDSMFKGVKTVGISGLDTTSAKSINMIFMDVSAPLNKPVTIKNELHLPNCKTADYAFKHSPFRKIKLRELGSIESFVGAFEDCYYLEEIPFPLADKRDPLAGLDGKKLKSISSLVTRGPHRDNTIEDVRHMFSGCKTLLAKVDVVTDGCKQIAAALFPKMKEYSIEGDTDERGFLKISNAVEAATYCDKFARYPGVVVTCANATELFNGLDLNIKRLDLSNVTNASRMFKRANIHGIGEIIGSDKIKTADQMFYNAYADIYPDIDLSGLEGDGKLTLFAKAGAPKKFPEITIGHRLSLITLGDDLSQISTSRLRDLATYMLHGRGDDYGYSVANSSWAKSLGESRLIEWMRSILMQNRTAKSTYIAAKFNKSLDQLLDKNGRIEFSSRDEWLALMDKWKQDQSENDHTLVEEDTSAAANEKFDWSQVKGVSLSISNASKLFDTITISPGNYSNCPLFDIDCSSVTNLCEAFARYRGPLMTLRNTQNVTDTYRMFYTAKIDLIQREYEFDFSHVNDAEAMFYYCEVNHPNNSSKITFKDGFKSARSINALFFNCYFKGALGTELSFDDFDFRSAIDCKQAFMYSDIRMKIDDINLPHALTTSSMFERWLGSDGPVEAQSIRKIDLPVAETANSMFSGCSYISQISKVNAPILRSARTMFAASSRLKTIGVLNLPNAVILDYMFENCRQLTSILVPKFTRNTRISSRRMFNNCPLKSVYSVNGTAIIRRNARLAQNN